MNTTMTKMTLGGSNTPICHGAGRRDKNLSDIVRRMEYVDANGELQKITAKDAGWLKAAAGCFGLMGVITYLTFELDPMTYALMRPAKLPVIQAIPPPPGMSSDMIPPALWAQDAVDGATEVRGAGSVHEWCQWIPSFRVVLVPLLR